MSSLRGLARLVAAVAGASVLCVLDLPSAALAQPTPAPAPAAVPAASVLCVLNLPSAALAQQTPAPAPAATLTAAGAAQIKPEPRNRRDEASIRKSVAVATAKALPLAIADARVHAAELAAAAGVTLGPLISIADTPDRGFPYFYAPQNGTFGNGRFCGQVRNAKTVVRNGIRRRVAVKGTHKVCRVPSTIAASVSLTFAVSS